MDFVFKVSLCGSPLVRPYRDVKNMPIEIIHACSLCGKVCRSPEGCLPTGWTDTVKVKSKDATERTVILCELCSATSELSKDYLSGKMVHFV